MKFLSLKVESRLPNKWSSEELVFGDDITLLYGDNGCGKTPTIRFIVYCLGYKARFQDDIYNNCDYVTLKVRYGRGVYLFTRLLEKNNFDISLTYPDNKKQSFYSEKNFTDFLFRLIGVDYPALTTSHGKATYPYLSSILPLFYVDQDEGYSKFYSAESSFIKDQREEMMRLSLGLPQKHSYDQKKDKIKLVRELDSLDSRKSALDGQLIDLRASLESPKSSLPELDERLDYLKKQLDDLKKNNNHENEAVRIFDELIEEKKYQLHKKNIEIRDLVTRIQGFTSIERELNAEIETLSLNEEARRVFSSFDDICSNKACSLFTKSSDSYAKNLLYLKDQLKDLNRNNENSRDKLVICKSQEEALERELEEFHVKKKKAIATSDVDRLIATMNEIMEEIFTVQKEKKLLSQIDSLEKDIVEILTKRDGIQNDIKAFRSPSKDLRLSGFRADFRKKIRTWLDILNTKNVKSEDNLTSNDITVDSNFSIRIRGHSIRQFSGSTRTRIILASYAALFELYLEDSSRPFRFLILDTPKQHDIDDEDLNNYFLRLKKLTHNFSAQLIFSSTSYRYLGDRFDQEWNPSFAGREQKMFLGSRG